MDWVIVLVVGLVVYFSGVYVTGYLIGRYAKLGGYAYGDLEGEISDVRMFYPALMAIWPVTLALAPFVLVVFAFRNFGHWIASGYRKGTARRKELILSKQPPPSTGGYSMRRSKRHWWG